MKIWFNTPPLTSISVIRKILAVALLSILFLLIGPVLYLIFNYVETQGGRDKFYDNGLVEGRLPKDYVKKSMVAVFSARAYGRRGAFGSHPWIAFKTKGEPEFTIAEVIGWRLRRNNSAIALSKGYPDRKWFGNTPTINYMLEGEEAEGMIPAIRKAIVSYPYPRKYKVWPGPNSNTFIEYIRSSVPGMKFAMPALSIGEAYGKWFVFDQDKLEVILSLGGYLGLEFGKYRGFRVHVLGLIYGFNPLTMTVYFPGFGNLGFADNRNRPPENTRSYQSAKYRIFKKPDKGRKYPTFITDFPSLESTIHLHPQDCFPTATS